ncbi:hypothetical protein SAMN05444422_105258 [Halobiforma haloterrestris]|uniref:MaoC like domain-containing protein n=1 Tax=Natronobacterium haloterrestre TaxID=148448 RepID=A0A1I1HFU8_NATHA|nr:hypothetical protein SAMN05444422_105258 [Halobiforma haloterrestris]
MRPGEQEFRAPVYTGEEITCEWTTDAVDEADDRYVLECSFVCTNEEGTPVLTGDVEGIVWKDDV